MSKATGGKAYFSKDWKDEEQAFASIRDDLAHLYALSYYPAANPNRGWRTITVKLSRKGQSEVPSAYKRWISHPAAGPDIYGGLHTDGSQNLIQQNPLRLQRLRLRHKHPDSSHWNKKTMGLRASMLAAP